MGSAFLMTRSLPLTRQPLSRHCYCVACIGRLMLAASLISPNSFPYDVKSGDLSKTKLIIEPCRQPSSTLRALGRSFMATDTVHAGRTLKMQKGWASVVTDQCYFMVELKWKMDTLQVCLYQDYGAYNNNAGRAIHLDRFLSCLGSAKANFLPLQKNHNKFYMTKLP